MVDSVLVLVDGQISEVGSYEDLMSHDGPFAQFLKTHLMQQENDDESEEDTESTLCVSICISHFR